MLIPEQIFRMTGLDASKTRSQLICIAPFTQALLPALTQTIYTVPDGYTLVVQTLDVSCTPGAAQNYTNLQIKLNNGAVQPVLAEKEVAGAANARGVITLTPGAIIPSGCSLFMTASFNAAAAQNMIVGNLVGWLLPKGGMAI